MTIVFTESFDLYNGLTGAQGAAARWANSNPGATLFWGITTGRFGGQCLSWQHAASDPNVFIGLPVVTSQYTFGYAIRLISRSAQTPIFHFYGGGSLQLRIDLDGVGITRFYNGAGTLIGTCTTNMLYNTWYYFEVSVVISDTVGTLRVEMDGNLEINASGLDTRNTVDYIDRLYLGGTLTSDTSQGGTFHIDDLFLDNSATSPGEVRLETLYVNADGATLDWTPSTGGSHFALLDETLVSTTDFISEDTVGGVDLLGLTNLSSTPAAIHAVNIIAHCQKNDAGTRAIKLGVKSGTTVSQGNDYYLPSSWSFKNRILSVDPNTGSAWTASAVNALEVRPEVSI